MKAAFFPINFYLQCAAEGRESKTQRNRKMGPRNYVPAVGREATLAWRIRRGNHSFGGSPSPKVSPAGEALGPWSRCNCRCLLREMPQGDLACWHQNRGSAEWEGLVGSWPWYRARGQPQGPRGRPVLLGQQDDVWHDPAAPILAREQPRGCLDSSMTRQGHVSTDTREEPSTYPRSLGYSSFSQVGLGWSSTWTGG